MNPKNFFAELKRRNVYKVAAAYAGVAVEFLRNPAGQFDRMAIYSPGSENVIAPRKK